MSVSRNSAAAGPVDAFPVLRAIEDFKREMAELDLVEKRNEYFEKIDVLKVVQKFYEVIDKGHLHAAEFFDYLATFWAPQRRSHQPQKTQLVSLADEDDAAEYILVRLNRLIKIFLPLRNDIPNTVKNRDTASKIFAAFIMDASVSSHAGMMELLEKMDEREVDPSEIDLGDDQSVFQALLDAKIKEFQEGFDVPDEKEATQTADVDDTIVLYNQLLRLAGMPQKQLLRPGAQDYVRAEKTIALFMKLAGLSEGFETELTELTSMQTAYMLEAYQTFVSGRVKSFQHLLNHSDYNRVEKTAVLQQLSQLVAERLQATQKIEREHAQLIKEQKDLGAEIVLLKQLKEKHTQLLVRYIESINGFAKHKEKNCDLHSAQKFILELLDELFRRQDAYLPPPVIHYTIDEGRNDDDERDKKTNAQPLTSPVEPVAAAAENESNSDDDSDDEKIAAKKPPRVPPKPRPNPGTSGWMRPGMFVRPSLLPMDHKALSAPSAATAAATAVDDKKNNDVVVSLELETTELFARAETIAMNRMSVSRIHAAAKLFIDAVKLDIKNMILQFCHFAKDFPAVFKYDMRAIQVKIYCHKTFKGQLKALEKLKYDLKEQVDRFILKYKKIALKQELSRFVQSFQAMPADKKQEMIAAFSSFFEKLSLYCSSTEYASLQMKLQKVFEEKASEKIKNRLALFIAELIKENERLLLLPQQLLRVDLAKKLLGSVKSFLHQLNLKKSKDKSPIVIQDFKSDEPDKIYSPEEMRCIIQKAGEIAGPLVPKQTVMDVMATRLIDRITLLRDDFLQAIDRKQNSDDKILLLRSYHLQLIGAVEDFARMLPQKEGAELLRAFLDKMPKTADFKFSTFQHSLVRLTTQFCEYGFAAYGADEKHPTTLATHAFMEKMKTAVMLGHSESQLLQLKTDFEKTFSDRVKEVTLQSDGRLNVVYTMPDESKRQDLLELMMLGLHEIKLVEKQKSRAKSVSRMRVMDNIQKNLRYIYELNLTKAEDARALLRVYHEVVANPRAWFQGQFTQLSVVAVRDQKALSAATPPVLFGKVNGAQKSITARDLFKTWLKESCARKTGQVLVA